MEIVILPALSDNYMYLLCAEGGAAIVDPADADVVMRACDERGLVLKYIFVTHHHHDHVSGIPALKRNTDAVVVGPDDPRIPGVDRAVRDGNVLTSGAASMTVLQTPGHGDRDVSYLLRAPAIPDSLFCGDTLFVSGCGRLLEGNAETMWTSLNKLAALPDETNIYCGHEYTEDNLLFALSLEPDDPAYQNRLLVVRERLREGLPSVPSTVGQEKKANPFLRCDSLVQFTEVRRRKDRF